MTVSRIADTRGRAEQFAYRQVPDSLAYMLIRAKLRVQSAPNPRAALDYFRSIENQGTRVQKDVAAYGIALAQLASGQAETAKATFRRLMADYPEQVQFVSGLAMAEKESKNYAKAADLYESALTRFPGNRALTLNYVRVLLTTRKLPAAQKLLRNYASLHGATPEVYNLLAETYSRLGNDAESHRYVAESYYANGETRAAILQLRLARKVSGDDFQLNAVIDERLKEWLDEEEERKKR